jgi:hypothetical protein
MLPTADMPFEEGGWLKWLTCNELRRLELLLEGKVGEAEVEIPDEFYRRALGRAVMGVDMREVDEQERASKRLLRIPNPDSRGRGDDTLLITYVQDQNERDLWHLDASYQRSFGGRLPAVLTTAEAEPLTAAHPWP